MSKKYIISGGCSYTMYINQYRDIMNCYQTNCDVQFIGLGSTGASIHYSTESIMQVVASLLKYGVSPQNIFVLVDYTQIGRISRRIPIDFYDDFNKCVTTLDDIEKSPNSCVVNDTLSIAQWNGWTKINETVYSIMQNVLDHKFPKYFKEWDTRIKNSYRQPIDIIEDYFQSIVLFQSYLRSVGVDHRSFFMNNVIEGWYYGDEKILKHVYTTAEKYEVPDLSNALHIKELSPMLDVMFDTIDLSKIVLHKANGNNYGGIDEYTIDNFPKEYFFDVQYNRTGCVGYVYGMHPNDVAKEHYFIEHFKDTVTDFLNIGVTNG